MEARRLEYPISPKYIPNWGVKEALRELVANALDTETKVSVSWQGRTMQAVIEDEAAGIPHHFWVLGEGEGGQIGQFHEGLKLAMLVLAREHRAVEVRTVGYTVRPGLVHSDLYQTEVMVLEFIPSGRMVGTEVVVECFEEELLEAKNRFLCYSKPTALNRAWGVYDAPGKLWINGVFAQEIVSLWGYDLEDKTATNRDRSVLDMGKVSFKVCQVLDHLESVPLLVKLFSQDQFAGLVEQLQFVNPVQQVQASWRKAFRQLFGDRACLSSGSPGIDRQVQSFGWTLVTQLPGGLTYGLGLAGVQTAEQIYEKLKKQKFEWCKTPLSASEQKTWDRAKLVAKKLVPDAEVRGTYLVEAFSEMDDSYCLIRGLYKNSTVYVRRDCLQSLATTVGVLVHERLHGMDLLDQTREFESAMTDLIGALAVSASGGLPAKTVDEMWK